MEILLLVIPIAVISLYLRLRVFESTFAVLLGVPILVFPLGSLLPLNWLTYTISLVILMIIAYYLQSERVNNDKLYSWKAEAEPILIFLLVFMGCFYFCNKWPDFIAIGERLRDYAILSSVLKSPVDLQEPWLAGFPLNYYVYWYRFGNFLHEVLDMPVWRLYAALQSFTYALYCGSIYFIFRRILKFAWTNAAFCMLLIGFGSNIEGIWSFFQNDTNWWGPSRVIKGAINEFPIWSFLLGDLHPHYINLPAVAFFFVLLIPALNRTRSQIQSLSIACIAFILIPLFLYNSNAWEVPFWLLASGSVALFLLIKHFSDLGWDNGKLKALFSIKSILVILLMLYGGFSLFLSSKHIIPADAPLHFVRPPIPESTTLEMFRHFGFPLSLISLASIMLIRHKMSALIAALVLGTTFLHSDAGVFLYLLLSLTLIRQILEHTLEESSPVSDLTLAFEALGLVSISLLLFPEILFVDDAYGGENERMNTIFKVYTLNWLLLHMFSFYLTAKVFGRIKMPQEAFAISKIFQIAILVLFLAFFKHTIPLRDPLRESDAQVVQPKSRGLSSVEKEFPGSANTIQALEQLPEGIVLEGQGNPYSYTSHVSTLASKTSYLGWANHVQLLNRAYAEIERREKLTEEFYNSRDCERRRQILETESIKYAVVGPLEKQRYKVELSANFECLNNLISEGEYKVYSASYPSP